MSPSRSSTAAAVLPYVAAVAILAGGMVGCRHNNEPDAAPAARPKATDIDPIKATPDYWLDQPAVASVTAGDFNRLFNAAERVARNHYFQIDQADRRAGLLVTAPATSKQFFEVWRNDTGTARGTLEASINTFHRTLRYEFTRNPDGTFTVTPKVLIERYSTQGHRVTTPAMAPAAFDPPPEDYDPSYRLHPWEPLYWYATGRDTALEKKIAESIESRVNR
jgi:hypothetical protein